MKNRDLRISDLSRQTMTLFTPVFETDENLHQTRRQAQEVAIRYNKCHEKQISAAKVHTCAVLHHVYQSVISAYIRSSTDDPFSRISVLADKNEDCRAVLDYYDKTFPSELERNQENDEISRAFFVHQVFQCNPAILNAMQQMLDQDISKFPTATKALKTMLGTYLQGTSLTESSDDDLFSFLTKPSRLFPDSLTDQINYILENWDIYLPDELKNLLLNSIDFINEEEHPHGNGGPGEAYVPNFYGEPDYESFTEDRNWMPNVVMIAKSTLVWLDQLSKKYRADISTLDRIPDCELDKLKDEGFTALWLIGLWERSPASKKIKNLCGNPDAESSAYSLKGYNISPRLGGWSALENLKKRCWERGIRLASDMVPNHTGLDSDWLFNHPDYFVSQSYPPFPAYTYNGTDLSTDPNYEIKIEDHYYNRTDAAVTFKRTDKKTGEVSYIFHGNDGTTMPWNDTAQLDFLNPTTREAVIKQIIEVAKNFPIIRFDAAMTLAKRHIQRLWYPKPGTGGDIAGRSEHSLSDEEFNRRIPIEFWREVVDRIQEEAPDTLLLAEAFWMLESYFVRTLGMHRVYNSAFMHMMKNEDNKKYRDSIKSILSFDPEILKRYVNFMNNPDEDTAIAQFGNGDKYFGVCTLLSTMPGLPMFGHGQIEGFKEKYGMEYQRAYWDEQEDQNLIDRHYERIFPLLKHRRLFSGCQNFQLFDVYDNDCVQESIYAYTNGEEGQMTLVLYNNRYDKACGKIFNSVPKLNKENRQLETLTLAQSLNLTMSPRRFVIMKNQKDNLIYLLPSMKICEEGMYVSLDGYQTVVYTEIHEVEDIDGIYSRLYDRLQGLGVKDLELEKKLLYLEPFFDAASALKNQKYIKAIKALVCGKGSGSSLREIMLALGTTYTYMEEMKDLFSKLSLKMHIQKPSVVMENLGILKNAFDKKLFKSGGCILADELVNIVSSTLLIIPFVEPDCSLEQSFDVVEKLMLDRFFNMDFPLIAQSAILASAKPKYIRGLLENPTFLRLIGTNEYQGKIWFKGEYFQSAVFITILSATLFDNRITEEESEKTMNIWLKKIYESGYTVNGLKSGLTED